MKNVKITIREPMSDGSVGIRSAFVEEAIKKGVGLEITTPEGTSVVDPNVWKSHSKIMKMEGKYPGNPMVLYVGWVHTNYTDYKDHWKGASAVISRKDGSSGIRKKVTTTKVTTIVIEEVQTKLL